MQIEKVLESSGLTEVGRSDLVKTFGPSFIAVRAMIEASAAIIVTDATQLTEMKAARTARLKLKAARVEVEKLRKETKEESLRVGQSVDKVAKMIASQCEIEEKRLEEAETFAERVEAARKAAAQAARREALAPFVPDVSIYPLGDMTEAAWGQLLTGSRSAFEAAAEAARKAEADRLAAIEAQKAEDARIRAENARLAKEAAERDATAKAEREKAAAELRAAQDKARSEREAAEKEAWAERQRLEAEARREREAREAVERKAREEREAVEAAKREEAERQRYQAEVAAEEEARKAAAPDAEKLREFAEAIKAVETPVMATKKGMEAMSFVLAGRLAYIMKVNAMADKLPEQAACSASGH